MEWGGNNAVSSQLTECPFCKKSLVEESSGWQFFDNTKELLAFIAVEYGVEALLGGKNFSDHADSTLPQWQKNLVKQAFDCGAIKILQGNVTADQKNKEIAVKQAVQKLVDTYRSSREDTEQIIWEFTNALGWGLPEPKVPTTQTTIPQLSAPLPVVAPTHQPVGDIGKLIKRAWQFAEDGDWSDAADYFNKVLDDSTDYAPAFLGLLCVDLEVSSEDKLANIKTPDLITNHKHYKRTITDPAIKSRLDCYIKTIKDRIDAEQKAAMEVERRKKIQDSFDDVCSDMNKAKTHEAYRSVILAFGKIDSNYTDINDDIKKKIIECEQLAEYTAEVERRKPVQDAFDKVCQSMNNAKSRLDYQNAIVGFSNIDTTYAVINEQVEEKIAECKRRIQESDEKAKRAHVQKLFEDAHLKRHFKRLTKERKPLMMPSVCDYSNSTILNIKHGRTK
jgi:hypothetical protein